ncbi:MAG: phospholipase D family protein [Elusimicrobia bacterium]|nr:phospholipase D family protein [Elusimicrobiota bacterium]
MSQPSLFPDPQALKSRIIQRRKDFDGLFDGYTRLRAISYVVSPQVLVDFLEKRGYDTAEAVVGENLAEAYRQSLAQAGATATERLAALVASGKVKLLVPAKTIHTKLYILERPGEARVIVTSANLTETARSAAKQVNYAWYADLQADSPWLGHIEKDYAEQAAGCTEFMGDLAALFKSEPESQRPQLVEAWLKSVPAEEVDAEARKLLHEIGHLATLTPADGAERVFSVKLPEAPAARRQAERLLAPLNLVEAGGEVRLNGPAFLRYIQESHGLPLMRVDPARREVVLGLDGTVRALTAPLPASEVLAGALALVEEYLNTVDLGQAPDPKFAKVSMFEALLYLFASPFADLYMRAKRRRYGVIDSRGPRFLYIYGPSQNGKSTFLRFVLKLIAGRSVEPVPGGEFTKRKVLGAAAVGTAFPLVFDDVVLATRYALFEEVLKSYWETWWSEDGPAPQIVLSSNAYSLKDWAKSRVKRLDFDVQFTPGGPGKDALARLFKADIPLFGWFAALYLEKLAEDRPPSDDELATARGVFIELYRHAARPLPDFFPAKPIEELYDPGRKAWSDLLNRLRKARIEWESDRASVHFADDMQHYEMREYIQSLPAFIKHKRRGKALVIETPHEFRAWLDGGESSRGWWQRLFRPGRP